MTFISEILIAVITSYLAFTNLLADSITDIFSSPESDLPIIRAEVPDEGETKLSSLPSRIGRMIPDILLRSSEYQLAALNGANSTNLTTATTHDPLEAIVNIFCTFTTDAHIRTTTGTGFFIDPDGVIMTNAHVAQFLLLQETGILGDTECIIRSGNPATPKYRAKLLYISPAWIQDNSNVINEENPIGTGERDYALLYVSESMDNSPLPARFPALNFDAALLPIATKNTDVVAAGYPAQDIIENGPAADLIPKKDTTRVSELYTFNSNYADVFSIEGSVVGAEGASGGPVLNDKGDVIGVIVTRGNDSVDGVGSLRAITISHINRTLQEETGFNLQDNLGGNLTYRAKIFSETLTPFLIRILQNYEPN